MNITKVAMAQYIIGVLVDDLERLNDKLVKEDITLLSRCNEHVGFLINIFDNSNINHDIDKPVKEFTENVFEKLKISAVCQAPSACGRSVSRRCSGGRGDVPFPVSHPGLPVGALGLLRLGNARQACRAAAEKKRGVFAGAVDPIGQIRRVFQKIHQVVAAEFIFQ